MAHTKTSQIRAAHANAALSLINEEDNSVLAIQLLDKNGRSHPGKRTKKGEEKEEKEETKTSKFPSSFTFSFIFSFTYSFTSFLHFLLHLPRLTFSFFIDVCSQCPRCPWIEMGRTFGRWFE